jgi:AcrR family transcriptional regulator
MSKRSQAEEARTRLIEAALKILRTDGMTGLTLDAVAQAAGISKGGLLHHFHTKNQLIEAILRHLFAQFAAQVAQRAEQAADGPGRWLRAYVQATFAADAAPVELTAILLSALTDETLLLRLAQEEHHFWQERLLNDGIAPLRARVIRLAADAWWLERLIEAPVDEADNGQTVEAELLALIEEAR